MAVWASGAWASGAWASGAWAAGAANFDCWADGAWSPGAWAVGAWGESETPPVVVVPPPSPGGDDRPPGWSKRRAKLKLNRERALTEQIRDIYRELTADPEAAARVEALLAPVVPPAPAMGESEVARVAALEARADALRRRADAMDTQAIEVEIALRVMYGEMQDQLMADDWEAIKVLLSEVL